MPEPDTRTKFEAHLDDCSECFEACCEQHLCAEGQELMIEDMLS